MSERPHLARMRRIYKDLYGKEDLSELHLEAQQILATIMAAEIIAEALNPPIKIERKECPPQDRPFSIP